MTTEELKNEIAGYCGTRPEIMACYLYGSRATGRERPGSDVDLAFLLAASTEVKNYSDLKMAYCVGLGERLRLDIHPLIMNDAGEIVLEQIFRKGAPVYGNDSLEFLRFRMIMTAQIAEFLPLRERMESSLFKKYKGATV